ncbi:hypothetical protein [Kitasatospora sp. NPDC058218]|uniref:hypothetical protein n=1 Tax=Kitasatospora sp. NPDC058218 TaxID=3346385 RepID=UPI0036D7DDE9
MTATDGTPGDDAAAERARPTPRVRLPGFISDEETGLGDVVKRVTSTFGIRPCGGCERRAETLNRWVGFGAAPRRGPGR